MNQEGMSHRIAQFIGHLHPMYSDEEHGGVWGARSLADGTLILPMTEDPDEENGTVKVYWQGNPNNYSEISGRQMATLAVARYVEIQSVNLPFESRALLYESMAAHYEFKTGDSLVLEPTDPENKAIKFLIDTIKKVGVDVISGLVKAKLGL